MRPNASPSRRPGGWTDALIVLLLDVVLPLAVFYLARGLGAGPWLALLLAVIAPAIGLLRGWWRSRQTDPTALFVIAAPVLSIAMALITGDVRLLLARESWLTAATGGWIIISLAMTRPFLLDVAVQTSPLRNRARMEALWREHRPFRRWLQAASFAWGTAFLLDAVLRVVLAYTAPLDLVPVVSVASLIVLIAVAQAGVMLHGRRTGILRLLRADRHSAAAA